uniref:Uncharacterized protein n=1 Tax=Glossina palpalis gambiensis TaxID=67801 RepID=A0A1B0AXI7_9MUSC
RRGSPVTSEATASNSSNGGAINKSRKLIGRILRLPPTVLEPLNCSATVLICCTNCSTSVGAPTKLTVNCTGSRSGPVKDNGRNCCADVLISNNQSQLYHLEATGENTIKSLMFLNILQQNYKKEKYEIVPQIAIFHQTLEVLRNCVILIDDMYLSKS